MVTTTVLANTPTAAAICGTAPTPGCSRPVLPTRPDDAHSGRWSVVTLDEPAIAHEGLFYEAAEAARCIGAGRAESPLRPVATSIATGRRWTRCAGRSGRCSTRSAEGGQPIRLGRCPEPVPGRALRPRLNLSGIHSTFVRFIMWMSA